MKHHYIDDATLTDIYNDLAPIPVSIINETHEEAMPQLFAYMHKEQEPGLHRVLLAVPPQLVLRFHESSESKDLMMAVIRGQLAKGTVDVYVHISEAWMAVTTYKSAAEANAMTSIVGGVKNMPGRTEALMIALHTRERTVLTTMPITGEGKKRRTTLVPINLESADSVGRMSMNSEAGRA